MDSIAQNLLPILVNEGMFSLSWHQAYFWLCFYSTLLVARKDCFKMHIWYLTVFSIRLRCLSLAMRPWSQPLPPLHHYLQFISSLHLALQQLQTKPNVLSLVSAGPSAWKAIPLLLCMSNPDLLLETRFTITSAGWLLAPVSSTGPSLGLHSLLCSPVSWHLSHCIVIAWLFYLPWWD